MSSQKLFRLVKNSADFSRSDLAAAEKYGMLALARKGPLLSACLLLAAVAGCGVTAGRSEEPDAEDNLSQKDIDGRSLKVVATTAMVADLACHVGGDYVEVTALMGEGVDPHLYKATSGDVARLSRADLILYSGLHLEGKMGEVFSRLARKKRVVAVTDNLNRDQLLKVGGEQYDPHVWFDVALWSQTLPAVERALADIDPSRADEFRRNAERYGAQLAQLDQECRAQIASIPKSRRVLVTAHDAFHYFGRAYDIDVQAIQGISTQAEAAVSKINELVELLSERGIKAVFVETSVSERNIRALVEGCAARGHHVEIGGQLFSDAMGPSGTPEGAYIGMVRHNVETITQALR